MFDFVLTSSSSAASETHVRGVFIHHSKDNEVSRSAAQRSTPVVNVNSPATICIKYLLFFAARIGFPLSFASTRTYWVQTRLDGERVRHCEEDNAQPRPGWGLLNCGRQDPILTVAHGKLNATRCSLVEFTGQTGLKENPVGSAASFSIVSKDSFGNTRYVRAPAGGVQGNEKPGDWRLVSRGFRFIAVACAIVDRAFCITLRIPDLGSPLGAAPHLVCIAQVLQRSEFPLPRARRKH